MESKPIQLDLGIVTYRLNDAVEISFNPTDAAFVEKIYDTFDELDKKQESYRAEATKAEKREIFELARKRDAEMREMVDTALGEKVCDALFGGINIYAMSGGLPLWANLLLAIMDEIDTTFAREQKLTNPRIKKYSEKYKRK